MARLRRAGRFFERALLGAVMSVIAFFIERRLLKAIKEGGSKEAPPREEEIDIETA